MCAWRARGLRAAVVPAAARSLPRAAAIDAGLAQLEPARLGDLRQPRLGVAERLARGRRIGSEMDVDAPAFVADRDVDGAERIGRKADAGVADGRCIAHRFDLLDHL